MYRLPRNESEAVFNKIDFREYMNITDFTPNAVLDFIKSVISDKVKLYKYLAHKIGYRGVHMATAIRHYQKLGMVNLKNEYEYICSLLNMLRVDFFFCLESSRQNFAAASAAAAAAVIPIE